MATLATTIVQPHLDITPKRTARASKSVKSSISSNNNNKVSEFKVGTLVNVDSRTWPGINKPGGVGSIIKLHYENDNDTGDLLLVDVKYVLGGSEKKVELEFVNPHSFDDDSADGNIVNNKNSEDSNEDSARSSSRIRRRRSSSNAVPSSTPPPPTASAKKESKKRKNREDRPMESTATTTNKNTKELHTTTLHSTKKSKKKSKVLPAVTPGSSAKKATTGSSSSRVSTSPSYIIHSTTNNVQVDSPMKAPSSNDGGKKKGKKKNVKSSGIEGDEEDKKIAESSNFKKSTSKSTGETRKNTTEATSSSKKSTHPASKPNAHSYSGHTDSSSSGNVKSTTKQNNVLEGVYKDMSKSASSFVDNVVGKGGSGTEKEVDSLEIQFEEAREIKFTSLLNNVTRRKMVEEIQLDDLTNYINQEMEAPNNDGGSNSGNEGRPFSPLEIKTFIRKLEDANKVMVTWDTGTLYII